MGVINLANGYSDYINYGFEPISSDSDFSIARLASGLLQFLGAYDVIVQISYAW